MAVVKTRSAVVLVLSVLAAGIITVTLFRARWRTDSTVLSKKQQSSSHKPSALYIEKVEAIDGQALWRSENQATNRRTNTPTYDSQKPSPSYKEPGKDLIDQDGLGLENGQDQLPNSQESAEELSTVEKLEQLVALMHQRQRLVDVRKEVQSLTMFGDADLLKVVKETGRQPDDQEEKQHGSINPLPPASVMKRPGKGIPTRDKQIQPRLRSDSGNIAVRDKDHRRYVPHKPPTLALSTTVTIATPHVVAATSLPFITRGSVEIRPERLPPPAHSSDIYFSLLTAPKFHNLRFSLQYLTWLQTVDPKQVTIN